MRSNKIIQGEFEQLSALKGLTETYEDIAVSKMQQIRADVLRTREFLDGVSEIYSLSKAAYLSQVLLITNKKKRKKELDFIHKNEKTIVVFISGNHSLLGSVIFQSYKVFLELVHKIECDKIILGNIGRYLASGAKPQIVFSYYPLEDFELVQEQIKHVVDVISAYEKIFVVYPKFKSVLLQVPQVDDISGEITAEESITGKKRYNFEPNAREVMTYFECQIIGSLFRQKVLETMLAKFASRLTIMDEASQTVGKYIVKNRQESLAVSRRASNKKLLSSFAGISVWEK